MVENYSGIKQKLENILRSLEARVERIEMHRRILRNPDFAEGATEGQNDMVRDGIQNVDIEELKKVRAALERIDEGNYGLCIECGEPIVKKRLEALPYALTCISCAQ